MANQIESEAPKSVDRSPAENESTIKPVTGVPFTFQDRLFIFCGLMLVTCCFLPWRLAGAEQTAWAMMSSAFPSFLSIGWACLFMLWWLTLLSVSFPRFRPWLAILTAITVSLATAGLAMLPGQMAYGAGLAKLFALGLLVLSANPAIAKTGDLAMRRLNSQKAEVFTHWGTVISGVQFSAQAFYGKIEDEIRARQWPGVELLRILHSEAGLLSHKREYLRVIRQRQVFDVCAASFGEDYFFTLREAELTAQLTLATILIFLVALFMVFTLCFSAFGPIIGSVCFGLLVVLGALLLGNVLRMGLTRLDGLLMRTPVIGPVYETWFRRSTTYFQHDTRVVLLKLMDDLVKASVDEETSAKGITMLSSFEHQPIFDGFYKTSAHPPKGGGAK